MISRPPWSMEDNALGDSATDFFDLADRILIEFNATYFDGLSSHAGQDRVLSDNDMLSLLGPEKDVITSAALVQCTIVPALAKTRRSITLLGGAKLETDDRQSVTALAAHRPMQPGYALGRCSGKPLALGCNHHRRAPGLNSRHNLLRYFGRGPRRRQLRPTPAHGGLKCPDP